MKYRQKDNLISNISKNMQSVANVSSQYDTYPIHRGNLDS